MYSSGNSLFFMWILWILPPYPGGAEVTDSTERGSVVWYLWHFSICVSSLQKCFWEVGDDFLYWNLLGNKLLKRFISVWISTWKCEENLFVLIHWSAWLRRRRLTTKSSTTKCQNECPKVNQELWASANKLWVSIIIKIVHKPPKKKKHVKKHIWKKFGVIILHNDFPKQFVGAFI